MVFGKYYDLFLIRCPIWLPLIYMGCLSAFPDHGNLIALATMLLLAEPHFGATWTIFFDRNISQHALKNKVPYLWGSALLILISVVLFFFSRSLFFLLFMAFNFYHVTRQSVGVCKLYGINVGETSFQSRSIYLFNIVIFAGVLPHHMLRVMDQPTAHSVGLSLTVLAVAIAFFQYIKFKKLRQAMTTFTGLVIFLPSFFVVEAIHAILAGVTMHYAQYLAMTLKVYSAKRAKEMEEPISFLRLFHIRSYLFLIGVYGVIATVLAFFSQQSGDIFAALIIIPILGQMLHFYLDGLIWRFRDPKIRELNLRFLVG